MRMAWADSVAHSLGPTKPPVLVLGGVYEIDGAHMME